MENLVLPAIIAVCQALKMGFPKLAHLMPFIAIFLGLGLGIAFNPENMLEGALKGVLLGAGAVGTYEAGKSVVNLVK
jgi:hypothetical protein